MAIGTPATLGTNTSTGGLTITLTTTDTVPSGALVILCVAWGTGGVRTISTVTGGGLTYAVDHSQAYNNIIDWAYAVVSAQAPSGMASGTVITVTLTDVAPKMIAGAYCTGLQTSSVKDVSDGQGQASVSNWDTSSTSTTVADTLVIGGCLHDGTTTNTPTGGAAEINDFQHATELWTMCTEYEILSAAGSANLTGTMGTTSITTSAFVAYKGLVTAAPDTQTRRYQIRRSRMTSW